jgi:hypothetical protein
LGPSSHASASAATVDCDQLALFALTALLNEASSQGQKGRRTNLKPTRETVVQINFFDQEVLVGTTNVHLYVPGSHRQLGRNLTPCAGKCGKILSTAPASLRHPLSYCEQQIKINRMTRTLHYCKDCTEELY